jgi:hypothetical protein
MSLKNTEFLQMQKAFFGLVLPPLQFVLTNKINNISLNFVELHFTTLTQTVSAGAQDCMGIYRNRIAPVSNLAHACLNFIALHLNTPQKSYPLSFTGSFSVPTP